MNEAEEVGAALRLLRERAGLTQRELADRLDVQQPAVARWEAGGVRIPVNRIEQIVAAFGYGLEYDLTVVPIGEAAADGVPVRLLSRRLTPAGETFVGERVTSRGYQFAVDSDVPWRVNIWDAATGKQLPGAVAVLEAPIEGMVSHPDGVVIRDRRAVGKIASNGKRHDDGSEVFTYSLAARSDLDLAGVSGDAAWSKLRP
jgi:transcriptional regulator with XRE-family HTH domain